MQIRKIREEDLEDLKVLYDELCASERKMDSMRKAFERVKNNPDYYLLGAEVEGKIVGTLMGIICYDVAGNDTDFMTIENVVVHEGYRGHGICQALFQEIENIAKKNRCEYIYLVSGNQRKAAHALYEKLGYAEEGAKGFRKHFHA